MTAALTASIVFTLSRVDPSSIDLVNSSCDGKYTLIRPDFSCDEYTQSTDVLSSLRATLEKDIRQYELNHYASRISVWVRDLNTLQWVGVNEKEQYAPASLFKVPIMIAIFKYAEIQPQILSQRIVFENVDLVPEVDKVDAAFRLKIGQEYSIEELIEQMITRSDNEAYAILTQRLSDEFLSNVYGDLGIKVRPGMSTSDEFIDARSYANIFRTLYQSSYLTPEFSQKALEILSSTVIKEGARAGVPSGVKIAHKFGLRRETDQSGAVTSLKFHDCGIVYPPGHPYLFCILTEGSDEQHLSSIIATLSSAIYQSFSE
jgi:beta-lactamase class A